MPIDRSRGIIALLEFTLIAEVAMFCASCGSPISTGAMFCASCGKPVTAAAVPAPVLTPLGPSFAVPAPAGAAPSVEAAAGPRLSGLGRRVIAVILDMFVLLIVFGVAGMWTAVRWGGVTSSGFNLTGVPALIVIGLELLFAFLYYWLLEGLAGATLGKGIVGVRVRTLSGGPCSLGASLVRNLLRIIDALFVYLVGFLVAVFSKKRQRLGDHVAHTVVVEAPPGAALKVVLLVLWLGLLGGGFWEAYSLHRSAPASSMLATTSSSTLTSSTSVLSPPPSLASGSLQVINFAFLQSKDGPARPGGPFRPGEKVYTRYEFTGLTTDGQGLIHLVDSVTPLDPNGLIIYKPYEDTTDHVLGDAKTRPITFWFDIPHYAPPGAYKIQIKVRDKVKNVEVEQFASFAVEGEQLPAAAQAEVRDLHLALSEGGPAADPAVFAPGATVYMAGKVAGIQFRDDRSDARLALQVLGPKGDTLLDQPNFITFSDTVVYHPPTFFVSINGRVSLPSSLEKGIYTEKYDLVDNFANTTANYELKFEVR